MLFIFGYGSLINRESAERTLKRHVSFNNAILLDYRRDWSARCAVKVNGQSINAAFLNIKRRPGSYVNGVCFEISEDELESMKRREKNYTCIEVSRNNLLIQPKLGIAQEYNSRSSIQTFIYNHEVSDKEILLTVYKKKVLDGCLAMGNDFLIRYLATTDQTENESIDGDYIFSDPEQEQHV
jgi:hypothetical protein